jgi:hypothetical protein
MSQNRGASKEKTKCIKSIFLKVITKPNLMRIMIKKNLSPSFLKLPLNPAFFIILEKVSPESLHDTLFCGQ